MLGRTFGPQGLSAAGSWETGGPQDKERPLQALSEKGVHLGRNTEMAGLATVPTLRIPSGWEFPICDSPSPWGSVQWAPKNLRIPLGPGGKPELPLAHTLRCAHPATDIRPAPLPASCSAIPFITASWDPNGFHRGPTPTRVGLGQGGAPATPIPLLAPKPPSMFLLLQCVSPASSLPLLSAASLLFVPVSTLQPLHSSPTNLSWPLSPHSFLPSAPHRNVPGPATGPSASPSASLCTCLSASLCPVTSNSFSGADHLFPGCFAAVLTLWRGQNNFDFLIPSAVNLRSLLLSPSIFNLSLPLQLFQPPLSSRACLREHVPTCVRPRVCPPVCVRVCVCALLWPRLWQGHPRVAGRGGVSPCCPGQVLTADASCV